MFGTAKRERCKYCSQFLTDEQKQDDRALCIDCAKSIFTKLVKSFRIRAVFGVLCIALVFALRHFIILNASEYGEGVLMMIRVPTFLGFTALHPATFDSIMNLTPVHQVILGTLAFSVPFLKRVRFGMDAYSTFSADTPGGNTGTHPTVYYGRGQGDRLGLLISELFLSLVSGPYFLVHGIITMFRMKGYTS